MTAEFGDSVRADTAVCGTCAEVSTPEQMTIAAELANACASLAAAAGDACLDGDRRELRSVAGLMIARGAQSVASANLLAQAGLVGDAMSCGRTMVELAIDFRYIAIDPARRIARFDAYAQVFEHKFVSTIAAIGGNVRPDVLDELRRRRDEFSENNPGTDGNWAGCPLARRAEAAGRTDLYRLAYAEQCNASHSGPGTLEYTIDRSGETPRIKFGRQHPDAHPVALACNGMLTLIGDAVAACGLTEDLARRALLLGKGIHALVDSGVGWRR